MSDPRREALQRWSQAEIGRLTGAPVADLELDVVSGDASFRRYFRARVEGENYIAVDAPPANEDSETFVAIAGLLRDAGVNAPRVYAQDYTAGFMLLEDFGDELFLPYLLRYQQEGDVPAADALYDEAIASLIRIQGGVNCERLDPYDRKELRRELEVFPEWFCGGLLAVEIGADERAVLDAAFTFLEDAILAQPQVAVHRDYHSRNLLWLNGAGDYPGPGIIDFQDAVCGAYTYDLVSLLRDCYIRWDEDWVQARAERYLAEAVAQNILPPIETAQLHRDLDLMGLQRHLKVLGVFSRLYIRDNKPRYLADIPLVIRYFSEVARRYPEMDALLAYFEQSLLPVARTKLNLED